MMRKIQLAKKNEVGREKNKSLPREVAGRIMEHSRS